jgi:mono/diheme cytochrome c family protein
VKAPCVIPAQLLNKGQWASTVIVLLILISARNSTEQSPATSPVPENQQGSVSRGEALFTGRTPFHNRGPSCNSCHSIAGLPAPNEGVVGPSLTDAYAKLGPFGIQASIQTPFSAIMAAVYGKHVLLPEEQMDLLAFLRQNGTPPGIQGGVQVNATLPGSFVRGESLFMGRTHFLNRGPACISCHSIAGLPFPNGGTLGPDLTQTYAKLSPVGTQAAMQTLYFPTMLPIYRDHQLVPQEQADMVAYFKATAAEAKPQERWTTEILILAALALGIIFVALTAFFWRKRVLSVRRALVVRATGKGVRS